MRATSFKPLTLNLSEKPPRSQESIEKAIHYFKIKIPSSVDKISFDPTLADRGLTYQANLAELCNISIGPSAFASWSLLGSTIAHEAEVHANQNLVITRILDLLNVDGSSYTERLAYLYELNQAGRFRLSLAERMEIIDTVDFYYPFKFPSVSAIKNTTDLLMLLVMAPQPAKIHDKYPLLEVRPQVKKETLIDVSPEETNNLVN
jgi:hypothetical protein